MCSAFIARCKSSIVCAYACVLWVCILIFIRCSNSCAEDRTVSFVQLVRFDGIYSALMFYCCMNERAAALRVRRLFTTKNANRRVPKIYQWGENVLREAIDRDNGWNGNENANRKTKKKLCSILGLPSYFESVSVMTTFEPVKVLNTPRTGFKRNWSILSCCLSPISRTCACVLS